MKITLIYCCLVASVFLMACNSGQEYNREFYDNGNIKREYFTKSGEIDSILRIYYPSGTLKSVAHYNEGVQHGKTEVFYKNGSLKREVYFNDGIAEDTLKIYYRSGQLKEISTVSDGKKNGIHKQYFQNGTLKYKGYFRNDKKYGAWKEYDTSGNLINASYFQRGKIVSNLDTSDYRVTQFTNSRFGYKLKYPKQWIKETKQDSSIILFRKPVDRKANHKPNLTILSKETPDTISLSLIYRSNLEKFKNSDVGFKKIREREHVIDSNSAISVIYSFNKNGKQFVVLQTYIRKKKGLVIVTGTALKEVFAKYLDIFKEMTKSLTFIEDSPTSV